MKRLPWHSLWLLSSLLLQSASHAACPSASEIEPHMLAGTWQLEWTDGGRQRGEMPWILELAPHPEYAGSLKGHLVRGDERHLIVADWDDETLTMEESQDGRHIAATWQARATEGQCGRELKGIRFTGSEPDESARRFRMRSQTAR